MGKLVKINASKLKLLSIILVFIFGYGFTEILQRRNGVYQNKYLSPDGKYRIEAYLLSQTGRFSSNTTTHLWKVYRINELDKPFGNLIAVYKREIFNGSGVRIWDCEDGNKNCKSFTFSTGDGDFTIFLPPPWYERWVALLL